MANVKKAVYGTRAAQRRSKEAKSPLALAEIALEVHLQIFHHMLKGMLKCWRVFRKDHKDYLPMQKIPYRER